MGPESRKFESGCAGGDEILDFRASRRGAQRSVESEINPRLGGGFTSLCSKLLARRNQVAVVIRHIDDRRNAARSSRARRPNKVLLARLAATVDLPIDRPG